MCDDNHGVGSIPAVAPMIDPPPTVASAGIANSFGSIAVLDPASVRILNPFSPNRLCGCVLALSSDVIAIGVGQFLQRGTIVQVRVGNLYLFGEVRDCTPSDLAETPFLAGIEIQDFYS